MKLFAAFTLFALLGVSTAVVIEGECPQGFGPVEDFSARDYTGRWYEIGRYEIVTENNADCVHFEYVEREDGSIGFTQTHFDLESDEPNAPVILEGHMTADDPSVGRFNRFWGDSEYPSNYTVVATDYVNYSVVFDCSEILPGFVNQNFWIVTRTPVTNPDVLPELYAIILGLGIERDFVRYTVQSAEICGWE